MSAPRSAAARSAIFLIELYRHLVSPMRLPTCRFSPTCSEYAVDALTEYGSVKGGWLAVVRLLKCGPWHRGGWDPIPERPAEHRGCRMDFEDTSAAGTHRAARGESEPFVRSV
jgi:hypothetical protein